MPGTRLLVVVCAGVLAAGCGKVSVNADAKPTGPDAAVGPTLTSIAPTSGIVTTHVTLTGSNFGATQTGSSVTIGGSNASIVSWSDTSVVVSVPSIFPGDAPVMITTPGGSGGPQTFHVILPPMAYINNQANETDTFDSITAMSFDPGTGALNAVSGPISMGVASDSYGGCATSAIVHEHTRRLFASGASAIAVFDIDPVTGGLTKVPGSPFATGATEAYGLAVNAAGDRLFVADAAGKVVAFTIASTGALTAVGGSPFAATAGSEDTPVLSQNEKFLYVNGEQSMFDGFAVGTDGSLTKLTGSPFANSNAFAAAGRPGHAQLYIPDQTKGIQAWNLDPTTGAPTLLTGSPFAVTLPSGGIFHYPAFTSDGNRLYVGVYDTGYFFGFNLDAAGAPTAITGSPWNFSTSFNNVSCVAVSKDGAHLILIGESQHIVGSFSLDANGVPTQVNGSPFTNPSTVSNGSGLAITF